MAVDNCGSHGTIFPGFSSQLGMVIICLRLFSGLLHYCRRQILKNEPVHLTMGMPSVEKPPSWCIRKSSSLGLEEPNTNTTYGVTSDNVCIPTVPSANLT